MIAERIERLLTLNAGGFRRYAADGILVVSPRELAGQ